MRCDSLESLTIGNSVETIGDNAFENCKKLREIIIPNSVTTIGRYAFQYCRELREIIIPNSVITIDSYAFDVCDSLRHIVIGRNVASIGNWAFSESYQLDSITIYAATPPTMGNDEVFFYGISAASTIPVYIPCGTLAAYTGSAMWTHRLSNFIETKQLTTYPSGTIGNLSWVYNNCDSILTIYGNDTMPDYNPGTAPWNSFRNDIVSVIIGDSVKTIGINAFWSCYGLTSVTIGNSVETIGNYAFEYCRTLTSVIIPNSVEMIGDYAFAGCFDLESVIIGNSVKTIRYYAFEYCPLTSIIIPNSVKKIGSAAFGHCGSLKYAIIGNSVDTIENFAFADCSSLDSIIVLAKTPPVLLDTNAFMNVPSTIPIYIPCGTTTAYSTSEWGVKFSDFIEDSHVDTIPYSAIMCYGVPYTDIYFTTPITAQGTYYEYASCDSVVKLILTEHPQVLPTKRIATISQGNTYSDSNFPNLTQAGTYYDTLKNINGCDSIIELTLTVNVGVVETDNYPSLRVYPNPTSGQLRISVPSEGYRLYTNTY